MLHTGGVHGGLFNCLYHSAQPNEYEPFIRKTKTLHIHKGNCIAFQEASTLSGETQGKFRVKKTEDSAKQKEGIAERETSH